MTIPLYVLLGFAAWTVLLLALGVGVERWAKILSGRSQLKDFRADEPHGSELYRRATRAHLNCVENLPVYGAVSVVGHVAGVGGPTIDALALVYLGARIVQSSVHVLFPLSNLTVGIRFSFFALGLTIVTVMGVLTAIG